MNDDIKDKFTDNFKKALSSAHDFAIEINSATVEPEHLLYGLMSRRGSVSTEILNKLQITPEKIKQIIKNKNRASASTGSLPKLSKEAKKIIQKAVLTAGIFHHRYIGTEHLLYAILELPTPTTKEILAKNSVNTDDIQHQLNTILRSTSKFPDIARAFDSSKENNLGQGINAEDIDKMMMNPLAHQGDILELFTVNLTDEKIQQDIDPVIGRDKEISRVIQVLSRRNKNNPVLLGDPGVGKTAIVEGLAKKIVHGEVPDILLDKKILNLDLGLMLAGTMYRGEFEQRLKNLVTEIKKDPNIVLFIDEIHTLTGAGAAPGSMDAANILKPALARGEIRCIGATTLEEYRKHIESDSALERRFQSVQVQEPSEEKTLDILKGIKENYENFHRVKINDRALQAAVKLSSRYIADRFLPDKAIDLIDEAAAKIRVEQDSNGLIQKIKKIERGLGLLEKNKRQAILSENYSEALEYKDQELAIKEDLRLAREEWQKQQKKYLGEISDQDIARLVAEMTGITISELIETEKEKIVDLEKNLKEKIIGQDEAIKDLALAIRRSRTGISLEKRPVGSFVFLGPSGVGKTELAKVLAQELFEDPKALVKIDMSEFKESFNSSKLIGSPPGYVGYKESGQLTEAVRRRPYSVVLFDEIEKAHPEIFNILLQVMEDGELTDATGKKINFKNTIIIMTSNIGLKDFVTAKKIGFDDISANNDLYDEMKGFLEKSLTDQFRPEFLNRLDKTIFFRPLNEADLKKIVKLQIAELNNRLKEQKIKIQAGIKAVEFLAQKDSDPQQGARLIRKNIQELIENPLSEMLIEKKIKKNVTIKLIVKDNQLRLDY